jgi:hypothetical protein
MRGIRPFLLGGAAASALTIATDLLAGALTKGYDFVAQSISDLNAAGTPTRAMVLPVDIARDVLLLAMGAAVWRSAPGSRALRLTGGAVAANGAAGLVFASLPRHLDQPIGSPANTANTVAGAISVACFLAAMAFGSAAFRGWFRAVSIGTLLAYTGLAALSLAGASQPAAEPSAPTIGIQERTMVYAYLGWIVLLAIALWRKGRPEQAARLRN